MPERPQTVIMNTTPIIALALIGKLDLLQHLYGKVVIPPAVWTEVMAGGVGRVSLKMRLFPNVFVPLWRMW
jgi:predicted nucleic acid-binding protein